MTDFAFLVFSSNLDPNFILPEYNISRFRSLRLQGWICPPSDHKVPNNDIERDIIRMETDKIDADDITKIQGKTKTTEHTAILYGHSSL
jgi:hypothetical protein